MTTDTIKDPVCGMTVRAGESVTTSYHGRTLHFCSDLCHRKFLADPEKYAAVPVAVVAGHVDTTRRIAYCFY